MNPPIKPGMTRTIEGSASHSHLVTVEVMYFNDGTEAMISFVHPRRSTRHGVPEQLFRLEAGADFADQIISALAPILETPGANWMHTWVRVPNPKHRPGE